MRAISAAPIKFFQDRRLELFSIAVSLAAFNLILAWRVANNTNQLIVSVLLWAGILLLIWKKRHNLDLYSNLFTSLIGILIIVVILLKSISLFWFESIYLKILPLASILGLGLLASGFKGIKQYWRELIIIVLLCIPETQLQQVIEARFDITTLTAKFSTFVLHYVGFEVKRQGVNLSLPTGSVSVDILCTGIRSAILLFQLAVPFTFLFLHTWRRKILVLLGAILIAFSLSVVRVAFLAVIVADRDSFKYWHGGAGNEIFSTGAILIFGALCNFAMETSGTATNEVLVAGDLENSEEVE